MTVFRLRVLLLVVLCHLGFDTQAQYPIFNAKYSTIKFPRTDEGVQLTYIYKVRNKGNVPLEIYDFEAECTCTKVVLPERPIQPGEEFDILVTFDTNGKYFYQDRTIFLKTNTKSREEKLRFKVFVTPKEENRMFAKPAED
jgi:hypothetical protein